MKKTTLILTILLMSLATANAQWVRPEPEFSDMMLDAKTVQYLYNVEAGGFLLGANEWNTRASLSKSKGYKMMFVGGPNLGKTSLAVGDSAIHVLLQDSVETTGGWNDYDCQAFDQIWCDGVNRTGYDQWVVKCISAKRYNITNTIVPGALFGWSPYAGDGTNMRCWMLDFTQTLDGSPLFDQSNVCTTWAVVSEADYQAWQDKLETYVSAMTLGEYIARSEAEYEGINLAAPKAVYNNTNSTKEELDAALNQAKEIVNEYRYGNVSSGGVDCTDLIVNPSFEEGTEGWTYNYMSLQSNNSFTLKAGTNYMERWMASGNYVGAGSVSQTLTNLPVGVYRLTAAAQNIQQNQPTATTTGAWLFAGNERTTITVTDTYSVVFSHESGDVTIGFEATEATGNWIAVDNFTLTYYGDSIIAPSYIEKYNLAVEAAKAAIADEANAGATNEIAKLQALIDAEMPATAEEINTAREAIEAATQDLISAGVVINYERIMATYITYISHEVPGLDQWTGGLVTLSSQHWDDTSTSIYYEQTGSQWSQSSWTNSKSMSMTFPPGKYVICMAGRSASGNNVKAYLRVNDVEVIFPSKGDVGFGVDVNGVATMSPDATYANDGKGRGWEYRYVEFESDGNTPTYFTVGGEATAVYQWMSFTEPEFRTTEDNDAYALYGELTNANFTIGDPETVGIHTYEKDIEGNGDKAQAQPVKHWATIQGVGDAHAAGIFQYGSTAFLGANEDYPPTVGPDGQSGQALGILAVWGETTQYTQRVGLPAGTHTMRVLLYNAKGTGTIAQNLIGVNGIYASSTTYPVGVWTIERIDFTLDEVQAVTVSLGYQAENYGSSIMPHLFIDRVTIDEPINLVNNPYEPIAGSSVNTVDLSSMDIDWRNISDEEIAAAMQRIDWANVEALTIPENSTERITPYLSKEVCPKLQDVVALETTLPVDEIQKVNLGANVMVRMPEGATPIDASGNTVTAPDNVFIGGKAERVVLTDRTPYVTGYSYKGGNYFAKQITYTRTFGKSTCIGQSGGWEALVVPFNVTKITAADGRTLAPFGSTAQADANFWLAELTVDGFLPATSIEAGKPYIIAMPNNEEYDAQYNIMGNVTFSATNDSLYFSQYVQNPSGSDIVFTPSYNDIALTEATNLFTLNDDTYQTYLPGGAFVRGQRAVRPFEAYVTQIPGAKQRRALPIVLPEPTALYQIAAEQTQKTDGVIYDLTGRRVTAPTHGLYIKDGKKVLVK